MLAVLKGAGIGHLIVIRYMNRIVVTGGHVQTLESQYPVRLICPSHTSQTSIIVYLLSYGGGLVSGDEALLDIRVDGGACLTLFTQSSTKVFKCLPHNTGSVGARQCLDVTLKDSGSIFCLLPDPVQPFKDSVYRQSQTFNLLVDGALKDWPSVCLLDWVCSGRSSRGEIWQLKLFQSTNAVYAVDQDAKRTLLYREGLHLERDKENTENNSFEWPAPFCDTLYPYQVFGTLVLIGPEFTQISRNLVDAFQQSRTHSKQNSNMPPRVAYAVSPLNFEQQFIGCVLKLAAHEVWEMRQWLQTRVFDGFQQQQQRLGNVSDLFKR